MIMSSSDDDAFDQASNELKSFAGKISNAMKEAIQESLDEGKDHSVGVVHVVTGALRDTIRTENVSENGGDLVAGGIDGVEYAEYEEMGTSRREGHPYLRPGAEVAFRALESKIKEKIEAEIQ
jgi:HK97 gp10 family phage protein